MPRATQSKAGGVVAFFRTAPMEVAEAVLDMAKDAIKERKDRSVVIRTAQLKAKKKADSKAGPKAAPAAKVKDTPKTRKRHRNRARAAVATDQGNAVEVPPEADQDLLADSD